MALLHKDVQKYQKELNAGAMLCLNKKQKPQWNDKERGVFFGNIITLGAGIIQSANEANRPYEDAPFIASLLDASDKLSANHTLTPEELAPLVEKMMSQYW